VGPAFVCLLRKSSSPSLSANPAERVLCLDHTSAFGLLEIPWCGETSDNHLVQGCYCTIECSKFSHLNSSSNALTSADLQSCIVLRLTSHIYAFLFSSMLSMGSVPVVTVALQFVTNVCIKWYISWSSKSSSFFQPN